MTNKAIFKDIDLSFRKNTVTGDLNKKTDLAAVKQALRSIFLTNPYEKPFQPRYGIGLSSLLFENYNPVMVAVIQRKVQDQIFEYEPRCIIESLDVKDDGKNGLNINLTFHVVGNPILETQKLSFSIERAR